jgi:hypothetical protein
MPTARQVINPANENVELLEQVMRRAPLREVRVITPAALPGQMLQMIWGAWGASEAPGVEVTLLLPPGPDPAAERQVWLVNSIFSSSSIESSFIVRRVVWRVV